ncbi:dihydrodipicolinate synthase family protein [Rhizobium straminoryzae]|nr:dihydrodipicolinate synthase family protein [Rhizobium straminoryzae]
MPLSPFQGTFVDLVTPFRDGALDHTGLSLLIEWQIQAGIEGLVVCGEASESHCLTPAERATVMATAIEVAHGRVPVLAGIVTNATDRAITLIDEARQAGVDGAVLVLPYYNKPCAEGVVRHVMQITAGAGLPVLLLSRPATTMLALTPELVGRLAGLPNVSGIIDGSRDHAALFGLSDDTRLRTRLYCGDGQGDVTGFLGSAGCISWVANVAPRLAASLHHAAAGGNLKAAHALQTRLQPLLDAMDRDHPVSTLKQALAYVFGTSPEVRLPLVPVEAQNLAALRTALSLVGLSTDLPFLQAAALATQGGLRCRL